MIHVSLLLRFYIPASSQMSWINTTAKETRAFKDTRNGAYCPGLDSYLYHGTLYTNLIPWLYDFLKT